MRLVLFILAVFLVFAALVEGKTIYVPDDYAKIQEAIIASVDGDTIVVRQGTYVENITYYGKSIIVRSESGPRVTFVDGNRKGSVFKFNSGEGRDSVLEGFTITNGTGTPDSWVDACGGGVYCTYSSPTIMGNIITENDLVTLYSSHGGGIHCDHASPVIMNNIISHNDAPQVHSSGGGIHCNDCGYPVVVNNIVVGNWAHYGGGISIGGDDWTMTNNTIVENTAATEGGGVGCFAGTATIENCVLWNNSSPQGKEITLSVSAKLTLSHTNVEGGKPSVHIHSGSTLIWGTGMIDSNPRFVDESIEDFHLTYLSPCKDTGDNTAVTELTDFEGDPRIAYGTVDMGADEFYTHLYYTGNATPGGNVELKFVGLPGTMPVGLCIGYGVLDPPIPSMWGDWYLQFPIIGPIDLGMIPSPDGVLIIPGTIPGSPPPPYSIPIQTLIGAELTNWSILEVQ